MPNEKYPTFARLETGTGLIALPKTEAEWVREVLHRDGTNYEIIPDNDQRAFNARIALNACESKRTRAYRETQTLVAMQLPYTQEVCDDIMIAFSQYPLESCYPQHLEATLGLKLEEPSEELIAITNEANPNHHGTVFGIAETLGYIGWLLVHKLDVNATFRDSLTLDEQIRANTLYLENHREWKTFSNDPIRLCALDVPFSQATCDELSRAIVSVPLLPDAIVCAAYMHRVFNLDIEPVPVQPPRLAPVGVKNEIDVDEMHAIFGDVM